MRGSLLALQGMGTKINHTQERLSTGREVNSALDNPINYFASVEHLNRAAQLSGRKDEIREAVQKVSAANNGINAISNLLKSASALAASAQATSDQTSRDSLAAQFDVILSQIDTIAADSGYRGTNLLNGDSLTVNFSEDSGQSTLNIAGATATSTGLAVSKTSSGGEPVITTTTQGVGTGHSYSGVNSTASFTYTGPTAGPGDTITINNVDISGTPDLTATTALDGTNVIIWGSGTTGENISTISGDSRYINVTRTAIGATTYNTGDTIRLEFFRPFPIFIRTFGTNNTAAELSNIKVGGVLQTAGTDYDLVTRAGDGKADIVFRIGSQPADGAAITADVTTTTGGGANPWTSTSNIESSMTQLKSAIDTMRTNANQLTAYSATLTTRLDFISDMSNVLQTGSENLTLADMNEEGANMLMLQTRQSLGASSLSMSAQSAQSVLQMF